MKIEHVAFWVQNLEEMKNFYLKYFDLECNDLYRNQKKEFSSYFLKFPTGARIELMHSPRISQSSGDRIGLAHLAISVGSKERVNTLTETIRLEGYKVRSEPRTTGDGYYESVIEDPEGNFIEITL